MARLVITDPDQRSQILEISQSSLDIGRADSNDLVLDHPSVSRRHARLSAASSDALLIADVGSLNGVFVNGQQVQEHRLTHQDRISIGVFEITYEAPAEPPLEIESGPAVGDQVAELLSGEKLDAAISGKLEEPAPVPKAVVDRLRDLEEENQRLKLLLSVGKALSSALLPEEIMHRVMDLVFQMENVDRGFVMLRDEKGGFKPAVVLYKDEASKADVGKASPSTVVLSRKLIERVTEERLPLLIRNVAEDPCFVDSESLRLAGVRSAMCAPLVYKDNLFGIFYVDCLSKAMAFTAEELRIFAIIASEAAISFDNARSHEKLSRQALEHQALERFLSPAVTEKILANPGEIRLGGETQVVTIMFADIRGFTRIAERMEPTEVVEFLNNFFSEVADVIFENGGTLDKYMGDGLMALFGAPIARPDDPLRAVQAAIDMERALARVEPLARHSPGHELQMGVGINTGAVTAGNIGSARRMDYTVIGDAVNVAARLCAGALGGQVLVTESTFRELGGGMPARKLDPICLKGKAEPVEVYEILWGDTQGDGV